MPARRPKRAPEADLRAALDHADDHHVRDADAADEQRDRAEAEQQRRERRLRRRPWPRGRRRGRETSTSSGFCGFAVAPTRRGRHRLRRRRCAGRSSRGSPSASQEACAWATRSVLPGRCWNRGSRVRGSRRPLQQGRSSKSQSTPTESRSAITAQASPPSTAHTSSTASTAAQLHGDSPEPGSGWRSCARSPKRMAEPSTSCTRRAEEPSSGSCCPYAHSSSGRPSTPWRATMDVRTTRSRSSVGGYGVVAERVKTRVFA